MTNPMRASLIKGGIWLTVSRILFNLLGLVSMIVLARLLRPEDFGIVASAWTILAILTTILNAPVGAALIRTREPARDHIDTAWTLGAIKGCAIAVCIGLLAWPLALFFNEPALFGVIIALGGSVFISCLSSPLRLMLQRRLAFHLEFWIEVGSKLATVCASILIAWIYLSYWALVWGAVAGQVVAIVIGYAIAPYRSRFCLSWFQERWSSSSWLSWFTLRLH
jgi:PST family polysaccharide transporter